MINSTIEVKLLRKRIKNINLRINAQGFVTVSAPLSCPIETISRFLQEKQEWIKKHTIQKRAAPICQETLLMNTWEQQRHHAQMSALLPVLINKWETIIGVQVNQWRIKSMRSRWGSCNPMKKSITLNLSLIQKPVACLEYVLVHEMVHILEASHNQRFYALMSRFMPEWERYKALLKECSPY